MRSPIIRWAAGAAIALSLVGTASVAQAAHLTSTQISAILSLLQSFGADSATISNVQAALNGQPTTGSSITCVNLSSNLHAGITDATTGGQVSQLQQFLGVQPTGYFGPMTLQAVQAWQTQHGVVSQGSPDTTGYGFAGPQTRTAMGCEGSTNQPYLPNSPSAAATNPPAAAPVPATSSPLLIFASPQSGSQMSVAQGSLVQWTFADPKISQAYPTNNTYVILSLLSSTGRSLGAIGDGYPLNDTSAKISDFILPNNLVFGAQYKQTV